MKRILSFLLGLALGLGALSWYFLPKDNSPQAGILTIPPRAFWGSRKTAWMW